MLKNNTVKVMSGILLWRYQNSHQQHGNTPSHDCIIPNGAEPGTRTFRSQDGSCVIISPATPAAQPR